MVSAIDCLHWCSYEFGGSQRQDDACSLSGQASPGSSTQPVVHGIAWHCRGKQNTEAEAHEQLSYAFDEMGINFMDTAEM